MVFKKPISISFAPNFEKDDNALALKLLCGLIPKAAVLSAKEKLSTAIETMFSGQRAFLFSSGRSALYYAIKALGLQEGDEVLVQAFTCVAVPNAVVWNSLRPVFVDIDNSYNFDLVDLERKVTSQTKAILVQHTFGISANMEMIKNIASKHNLYIIEDCAHALGNTYGGKLLGTFGDVSILSFGRDKIISSVFGGVALSKDKNIAAALEKYAGQLETAPRFFALQQLFYLITYAISLPLYNLLVGKIILKITRMIGLLSQAVYKKEWGGQMPQFTHYAFPEKLAVLALQQWQKLEAFSAHRTKISAYYIEQLGLDMSPAPYLRVPYIVKNKPAFLKAAQRMGLHLGNWYRGPVDPVGSDLEHLGYITCPHAEELAKTTINLPTHINISIDDAVKIVTFIKTNKNS
jgi:dTDP-4-amino-4,6-dideoxygalactose transaminase